MGLAGQVFVDSENIKCYKNGFEILKHSVLLFMIISNKGSIPFN